MIPCCFTDLPKYPFDTLKEKAEKRGYPLDNPTVSLAEIEYALELKRAMAEYGAITADTNILKIASMLSKKLTTWKETFEEYNIYFDPYSKDEWRRERNCPLNWALAFAKCYIKILDEADDIYENLTPIDDDDLTF